DKKRKSRFPCLSIRKSANSLIRNFPNLFLSLLTVRTWMPGQAWSSHMTREGENMTSWSMFVCMVGTLFLFGF
ncbi:MAG: hypothetical protein ACLFQR_14025, partial [Desulfovibrionales bacterium]